MKHHNHPSTKSPSYLQRAVSLAATAIAVMGLAFVPTIAGPGNDNRAPELPEGAEHLQAPAGYKVAFHTYAVGVQVYVCRNISNNETPEYGWVFKGPEADLFANEDLTGQIGIHYAGPTWESKSGEKVVATRTAGATVDPTAIPWLLLTVTPSDGLGLFAKFTHIQRVNTTGGLAPTTECTGENEGEEVAVPYTAEYYFYRASGQ